MDGTWPITIKDAARRLDVSRDTVSDILNKRKLRTVEIPYCPQGRGIDRPTFLEIEGLLNPEPAMAG